MKRLICIFIALPIFATAQNPDRKINFPDIPDFQTLVCDLHQHTVFSDGSVWPDIRIQEAVLDGVDVISLTEHLEYQPHSADMPHPDRNRSFELAKQYAEGKDLIVIHGAEITRSMPPGHTNAIFIQDANKLLLEDPIEVFREAKAQGGFTFWNHPNWIAQRPNGIAELTEMHRELIENDLLDGIEVVNETTYSEEALAIAQENDLTIMSTSDIHGLIDWLFDIPGGGHRPVTLVFASDRTQDGIKEALEAGRTVAWFDNNLIGNNEYLTALIKSSIEVVDAKYDREVLQLNVRNVSDARLVLQNQSDYSFHQTSDLIELEPQSTTLLQVKTITVLDEVSISFTVLNAIDGPGSNPTIDISSPIK